MDVRQETAMMVDFFGFRGAITVEMEGVEFLPLRLMTKPLPSRFLPQRAAPLNPAKSTKEACEEYDSFSDEEPQAALAVPPQIWMQEVRNKVLAIISEASQDEQDINSELISSLDSLSMTLVINKLQLEFGVSLSLAHLTSLRTVGDLAAEILLQVPAPPAPPALAVPRLRTRARTRAESEAKKVSRVSVKGVEILREASGPLVFLLPGHPEEIEKLCSLGSDIAFGVDLLAASLAPCWVARLCYDEAALACGSLEAMGQLHAGRILKILRSRTSVGELPRLLLVAESWGCAPANAAAEILWHEHGVEVQLLFFDHSLLEPGVSSMSCKGHQNSADMARPATWLGGSIEAALLVARAFGAKQLASETLEVARSWLPEDYEEQADYFRMRLFWLLTLKSTKLDGMDCAVFEDYLAAAGRKADHLRRLSMQAATNQRHLKDSSFFVLLTSAADHLPSLHELRANSGLLAMSQ